MRSDRLQRWFAVGAMLALPVMAYAQEAGMSGTVTDTTGGALPGVTVRAVHEASGNSFDAVTDARGAYRLAVRVGAYRLTAELAGFASVTRSLTVLLGQEAVVNLQMGVSGVQESVTVTGEAPLLDTTQSSLGGNVDPRQLQDLPINGRNWMDLLSLTPGARGNSLAVDAPASLHFGATGNGNPSFTGGDFQLNVDGQQITNVLTFNSSDGQPHFSRDAIAEFEFKSSQFDVTQGRSSGVQVNAITKSGANTPSGSFAGYFRDDRFNAADFVAKDAAGKPRVLPYQDQQLSATFGGPIRKDKLHFFANYEYEHEPRTVLFNTGYPVFDVDLKKVHSEKKFGGRLDAQFSPRTRLAVRYSGWRVALPNPGGNNITPSAERTIEKQTNQYLGTLTQVLSNQVVNEAKVGYSTWFVNDAEAPKNPNARFLGLNGPVVLLKGLTAGGVSLFPQYAHLNTYNVRDDFTFSFTKGGRHTVKLGAEYLFAKAIDWRCLSCEGELDATNGPIPNNAVLASIFPDLFDVTTWNLAPLSSNAVRFRQTFGQTFQTVVPRYTTGVWVQDDWTLSPRLTLNLGVRYDLELNAYANDDAVLPMRPAGQPNDKNNVGPRLGFSFSATDRTVIRGGFGVYYGTTSTNYFSKLTGVNILLATPYDTRADFGSNPYNGSTPTFESLLAKVCTPALVPGCIRRDFSTSGAFIPAPGFTMPYSYQSSIGLQRQLGTTMAIEADYTYLGARDFAGAQPINLTYDPATGANYPADDISKKVWPEWGFVKMFFNGARANQHSLQTAWTKRFSQGWQASGTYTLSVLKDAYAPPHSGVDLVPFKTAPDLGGEYTLAIGDQRHRATVNGIWELRYGFQLSGLYVFGSGERFQTAWGTDLRRLGTAAQGAEDRLRPDGTIVPRNNLVGKPIHRVDLRLQRRFPLGGRAGIDGLLELFNAFNHVNYGNYGTSESNSKTFQQPSQSSALAYVPRTLQLGFRVAF